MYKLFFHVNLDFFHREIIHQKFDFPVRKYISELVVKVQLKTLSMWRAWPFVLGKGPFAFPFITKITCFKDQGLT